MPPGWLTFRLVELVKGCDQCQGGIRCFLLHVIRYMFLDIMQAMYVGATCHSDKNDMRL